VYDSWEVCREYILYFSGVAYQSYLTRTKTDEGCLKNIG
jgi:hypothetical protein